jgi:hypothetical protein
LLRGVFAKTSAASLPGVQANLCRSTFCNITEAAPEPSSPTKKSKAAPLPLRAFLSTRSLSVTSQSGHTSTAALLKAKSSVTGGTFPGLPVMVTFLQTRHSPCI